MVATVAGTHAQHGSAARLPRRVIADTSQTDEGMNRYERAAFMPMTASLNISRSIPCMGKQRLGRRARRQRPPRSEQVGRLERWRLVVGIKWGSVWRHAAWTADRRHRVL